MKNLIIALFITLSSMSLMAQEQFNGIWQSEGSSYVTIILASKYKVLNIHNVSFHEINILKEKILTQTKTELTTEIYNSRNGYYSVIKYTMQNDSTLISTYSAQPNKKYKLTLIH